MTLSYKYRSVPRLIGNLKSPSIPVRFSEFDTLGLVDSGADTSVLPQSIAELSGISLEGQRKPAGVGGFAQAVDTSVVVSLGKPHEQYRFLMPIKVVFSEHEFPVLLGREGFFDRFIITFDQKNEKVLLKNN